MKTRKVQVETRHDEEGRGLDVALGLAVKRLREHRNMTQTSLAREASVSQSWVSLTENAETSNRNKRPSLDILQRIACALGLPRLSDLIAFAEEMTDVERTLREVEESTT